MRTELRRVLVHAADQPFPARLLLEPEPEQDAVDLGQDGAVERVVGDAGRLQQLLLQRVLLAVRLLLLQLLPLLLGDQRGDLLALVGQLQLVPLSQSFGDLLLLLRRYLHLDLLLHLGAHVGSVLVVAGLWRNRIRGL